MIYDIDGRIHGYVEHICRELVSVGVDIFFIINGFVTEEGERTLKKYTNKELYIRDNRGYDGGAYADFLLHSFDKDTFSLFEEVIFCNDSFFGPFVSMKELFDDFHRRNVDFWGIHYVNREFYKYIESYFLVFEKNVIRGKDRNLYSFFVENSYLQEAGYDEVCAGFERGLFSYLKHGGFTFDAYCKGDTYDIFYNGDVGIIKYGLPIFKKRSLRERYNNIQLPIVYNYVKEHYNYPIQLIKGYYEYEFGKSFTEEPVEREVVERRIAECKFIPSTKLTEEDLIEYFSSKRPFYIYGAGKEAGRVFCYYKEFMQNLKGFVISDDRSREKCNSWGYPLYTLGEVPLGSRFLIVMGPNKTKAIIELLADKYEYKGIW